MSAYYYKEAGKVKQINLHPSEYASEAEKHELYTSKEEARRA